MTCQIMYTSSQARPLPIAAFMLACFSSLVYFVALVCPAACLARIGSLTSQWTGGFTHSAVSANFATAVITIAPVLHDALALFRPGLN